MAVYNTKNYLVFGLWPLSNIIKTRERNVLATGSVFHPHVREETPTLLGSLENEEQFTLNNATSTTSLKEQQNRNSTRNGKTAKPNITILNN
jgi:hypothetical protein